MIETEIKLRVEDAEAAIALLETHGYAAREARRLQIDEVYDLPDGALRRSGRLLRLRALEGKSVLTYKGPTRPGRHKSREEIEAATEDSRCLAEILDRLGYKRSFRYEKYRTSFDDREEPTAVIALDETPIGVFLELEGPAAWIDQTAQRLGFAARDYITASYASLYRDHLMLHPGPADMIFLRPDLGRDENTSTGENTKSPERTS